MNQTSEKPKRSYIRKKIKVKVDSKRKLIDIPVSIFPDLQILAKQDNNRSLKSYIEKVLTKHVSTDPNILVRIAYIEGYKRRALISGHAYDELSEQNAIRDFEIWIKQ